MRTSQLWLKRGGRARPRPVCGSPGPAWGAGVDPHAPAGAVYVRRLPGQPLSALTKSNS